MSIAGVLLGIAWPAPDREPLVYCRGPWTTTMAM